jgi:hypothetical protein
VAGLNELIKFVNAISKEDSNVTKGINEIFLKINNSVNQLGQTSTQNTDNVQKNASMQDNVSEQEQEQEQDQNQDQGHRSPRERVRLEDNTRCNTVITNNNKTIINEIFKYEFDNDRLVEGMIFTEVFGKPLSKRKPRRGRTF